jgi:hypothetical protein
MSTHFDYMTAPPVELSGNPGELPPHADEEWNPLYPPKRLSEAPNIYPSGYQRSKAPSWHLLYEPFLAAMVQNMMRGEKVDGPGNPPNYLKATPYEDQYTVDHLRQHLSELINGNDIKRNAVSVACNAMILYHCLSHREKTCKSK